MGKKSGSSWLTAVKRAFRSPTKDSDAEKKSCRRKVDHQQDVEVNKSERRRWLFKKHSSNTNEPNKQTTDDCIAVTAATAKAPVEIFRQTQPSTISASVKVIQTAFRGYLARRALIALKGIVKLQALIRGQNVRKQANMTMKCMQSLLRVQARVRDRRARLSHDAGRRSMFSESSNLCESKYHRDIRDRKSRLREGSCVTNDWRSPPPQWRRTLEELEAILRSRNEAVLAHAQHNRTLDCDRSGDENRANWLDKYRRIEIDSFKTPSFSATNGRKSRCQSPNHRHSIASPHHRLIQTPESRCQSSSTVNTPSLRSTTAAHIPNYMAATESAKARIRSQSAPRQRASTPERDRSTAARKRLSYPIPEPYRANFGFGCNNNIVRQNLKSPSFKSVHVEERSSYSCYTENIHGEISPCSTTDLRRWLR